MRFYAEKATIHKQPNLGDFNAGRKWVRVPQRADLASRKSAPQKILAGPPRVKKGAGRWRRYAIRLRGCTGYGAVACTSSRVGGLPMRMDMGNIGVQAAWLTKQGCCSFCRSEFFSVTQRADQTFFQTSGSYDSSGQTRPRSYTCAPLQKWRVQPCTAQCRSRHPE